MAPNATPLLVVANIDTGAPWQICAACLHIALVYARCRLAIQGNLINCKCLLSPVDYGRQGQQHTVLLPPQIAQLLL